MHPQREPVPDGQLEVCLLRAEQEPAHTTAASRPHTARLPVTPHLLLRHAPYSSGVTATRRLLTVSLCMCGNVSVCLN